MPGPGGGLVLGGAGSLDGAGSGGALDPGGVLGIPACTEADSPVDRRTDRQV